MKRPAGIVVIPFGENILVDETGLVHRSLEKLAAVKRQTRLFKCDGAGFKFDGGQPGFLALVKIASALGTAEFESEC